MFVSRVRKLKRNSLECKNCNTKNCKFESTLAFYERETKIKIDCWLRNYDKKYITGMHFPVNKIINLDENGDYLKTKAIVHWVNIRDQRKSVIVEKFMDN